jgi:hypothetical protein
MGVTRLADLPAEWSRNKDRVAAHHDALEFPDEQIVPLTFLCEGQQATVLQLPAEPKTVAASGRSSAIIRQNLLEYLPGNDDLGHPEGDAAAPTVMRSTALTGGLRPDAEEEQTDRTQGRRSGLGLQATGHQHERPFRETRKIAAICVRFGVHPGESG